MKERPKYFIKVRRTFEAVVEIHAEEKEIALGVAKKWAALDPESLPWSETIINAKVLKDGKDYVCLVACRTQEYEKRATKRTGLGLCRPYVLFRVIDDVCRSLVQSV